MIYPNTCRTILYYDSMNIRRCVTLYHYQPYELTVYAGGGLCCLESAEITIIIRWIVLSKWEAAATRPETDFLSKSMCDWGYDWLNLPHWWTDTLNRSLCIVCTVCSLVSATTRAAIDTQDTLRMQLVMLDQPANDRGMRPFDQFYSVIRSSALSMICGCALHLKLRLPNPPYCFPKRTHLITPDGVMVQMSSRSLYRTVVANGTFMACLLFSSIVEN